MSFSELIFSVFHIQATLFRIFQQVFHAPKSPHNDELRRFAVYIVRQFVTLAPKNPKIYAELLFYKSLRETYMIENGYEDQYEHTGG
jgi:timeless